MKVKFTFIVAVMAALAAFIYGVNRLSTQFHPYGNWIILTGVLACAAAGGAWAWDSRAFRFYVFSENENGHYSTGWKNAKAAEKREREDREKDER